MKKSIIIALFFIGACYPQKQNYPIEIVNASLQDEYDLALKIIKESNEIEYNSLTNQEVKVEKIPSLKKWEYIFDEYKRTEKDVLFYFLLKANDIDILDIDIPSWYNLYIGVKINNNADVELETAKGLLIKYKNLKQLN